MKKIVFIVLIGLCFLSACSPKNALDTISVTGIVQVDGKPMEGVNIIFNPADGDGIAAGGVTDKDGKFVLTSGANSIGSGALEGEFIPTFSKIKIEEREPTASPEEELRKYKGVPAKTFYIIPQKYSNVSTCGMNSVKVEKGKKNVFNFDLSTE